MSTKKFTLKEKCNRIHQVLKKRNRLEWFLFLCVAAGVFFVFAVIEMNITHGLLGLLMCCFAYLQYQTSNREHLMIEVLEEYANTKDKLVVAEHELDRLKMELEEAKAKAKRPAPKRKPKTNGTKNEEKKDLD